MINPTTDKKSDVEGWDALRVYRDASWYYRPIAIRTSVRFTYDPTYLNSSLGFRIVRNGQ